MEYFVIYIVIGVCAVLFTRAREQFFKAIADQDMMESGVLKAMIFGVIVTICLLLFWPFLLPGLLKKPESVWDALVSTPEFRNQKALYDALSEFNRDGPAGDTIQGGIGEFGYDEPCPSNVRLVRLVLGLIFSRKR